MLYIRLLLSFTWKLQLVQNAARLLAEVSHQHRIKHLLRELALAAKMLLDAAQVEHLKVNRVA